MAKPLLSGRKTGGKPLEKPSENRRKTVGKPLENRLKTVGKRASNRWKTAGRPLAKRLESGRRTAGKTAENRRGTTGKNCWKTAENRRGKPRFWVTFASLNKELEGPERVSPASFFGPWGGVVIRRPLFRLNSCTFRTDGVGGTGICGFLDVTKGLLGPMTAFAGFH